MGKDYEGKPLYTGPKGVCKSYYVKVSSRGAGLRGVSER